MTAILGLNAFHADASACLLRNGQLVAAVEEERLRRVKHWAGLPVESIRYCLESAKMGLRDVSVIAINSDPSANLHRKIWHALSHRPKLRLLLDRMANRSRRQTLLEGIAKSLGDNGFRGELHLVEHHLAHMASTFFCSPFDEAVALSIDGSGDFSSTAWGEGESNRLTCDGQIHFPHSLGIFFETITHFLGFKDYGDEYKVMGLASYGEPTFLAEMERIVVLRSRGGFRLNLNYFCHHSGAAVLQWDGCAPKANDYFTSKMIDLLGPPRAQYDVITQRHKNIAHSAQLMYERSLFHLLSALHERYGSDALVLSGGCAFNSVANGKIKEKTPFRKVFIQPAAGDAGGALGAALYSWHLRHDKPRTFEMKHAFWGPEFSDEQIDEALSRRRDELARENCNWHSASVREVVRRASIALSHGSVVGWFQGRMEWGPRALGNRSILADPRRPNIKDILNQKIKRRESFRPFAPAILKESVSEWFESDDEVPFMMKVYLIREERRQLIPAVTHVDGTGRLQTVEKSAHPLFHQLIVAFRELTGIPMLLNTSFNENEPIVCTADQAIDCFLRTRMDMLVLGTRLLERKAIESDCPDPASLGAASV